MKNKITKTDIKRLLKDKLANNAGFAKWALGELYDQQTESEQVSHRTAEYNGKGFSSFDGKFLTSLEEQLKTKGYLSPRQMERLHKQIPKYWKQIADILGTERLKDIIYDGVLWKVDEVEPNSSITTPAVMVATANAVQSLF